MDRLHGSLIAPIKSIMTKLDLSHEDYKPEVCVYRLKERTSAGNLRLQVVFKLHDEASNVVRKTYRLTLDGETFKTVKDQERQIKTIESTFESELEKAVRKRNCHSSN